MRSLLFFVFLVFVLQSCSTTKAVEKKEWCPQSGRVASDEKKNADHIHEVMCDSTAMEHIKNQPKLSIPLRFGIVQSQESDMNISDTLVLKAIEDLNYSFRQTGFEFYLDQLEYIDSDLKLEDLSTNSYALYNTFSQEHDMPKTISVYVFDHGKEFCNISNTLISCGRTGGFSYILSEQTNNIVISRFDLTDIKVIAHEMGHFWGLYHTFEETQFGKDEFDKEKCEEVGDRLCDTPPDPGPIFEVHINYTSCEFMNLTDENGNEYKPMIENFMSYYKPCYLKEYVFTDDQVMVMRVASMQKMRERFIRK